VATLYAVRTMAAAASPRIRRHRRQHGVACTLSMFSVIILAVFSVLLALAVAAPPHGSAPPSVMDASSALRLAASVLLAQTLSCFLLLLPLLSDCLASSKACIRAISMHMARAATVCTCLTGLSLVVTAFSLADNLKVYYYLAAGILLILSSCVSLMASFWPADDTGLAVIIDDLSLQSSEEEIVFEDARQVEHNDDQGGVNEHDNEHGLLLPISQVDLAEVREGYRLLHDKDTLDIEAPVPSDSGVLVAQDTNDQEPQEEATLSTPTSRITGTRRLLQLAAPQVLYLYAGCAVLLVRLPFSLAIPHFVSTTLTAVATGDFSTAQHEIIWLLTAGSIDSVLDFWCVFLFGYANQRIVRGVRLDLFQKLLRQDATFFDQHSSGSLASRLQSDCSEMAGDLTWFFRFSIESVVRITGIATYMLCRSPVLGGCALAIVPVVAVINKVYGDWLRKNAAEVQDALAQANAVAQEALSNIRTVIAFAGERHESTHYKSKIDWQYQLNIRQLYMSGVYYMTVSTFLINTIVQASLLWIGTKLIQHDKLTAGVLLAFMLYQAQLQNETLNLFQSYSSLIKSSGAGDKVFALLDRIPPPPAINCPTVKAVEQATVAQVGEHPLASPRHRFPRHHYNVQFCDVSFHYASRPDHAVLHNLNLTIPKGQTVALVGPSGCGKSTIVNLIQRLYDPCQGSVRVDGIDLRSLDLLRHRRHLGVVTQDPILFSGTVLENIVYGCPSATREQAIEAAQQAHADIFIREFSNGYETEVGERGVQLSGGQKQRIAIARALVRNPSVLCLDEATAALDVESEHTVQLALDQLLQSKNKDLTTVIVAHRLRTVRNADLICFLENGRVVEQGSHQELLHFPTGRYRRMVERASSNGVLPEHLD